MALDGNDSLGAVLKPDPFDFDPEDFVEGTMDHGDGAWGDAPETVEDSE